MINFKNNKGLAFLCLITVFAFGGFAQDGTYITVRDMESWSRASFQYEPSKKWAFNISEELRLKDNSSIIRQYFTQIKTDYNITKGLSIGFAARYIRINDNQGKIQGYENHLRLAYYTQYSHKLDKLKLKYRLQYQNRDELGETISDEEESENKIRLRLASSYNIKNWKLDPQISAELFNTLGDGNSFSKFRITLGTEYTTKHIGSFELFYRIQKEMNVSYPLTTHIVGLQYTYTLKGYKK